MYPATVCACMHAVCEQPSQVSEGHTSHPSEKSCMLIPQTDLLYLLKKSYFSHSPTALQVLDFTQFIILSFEQKR